MYHLNFLWFHSDCFPGRVLVLLKQQVSLDILVVHLFFDSFDHGGEAFDLVVGLGGHSVLGIAVVEVAGCFVVVVEEAM